MRIFKHVFILPFKFHCGEPTMITPGKYGLFFGKWGMAGTMEYTCYYIRYLSSFHKFEVSFYWRPSVTAYWWKDSLCK